MGRQRAWGMDMGMGIDGVAAGQALAGSTGESITSAPALASLAGLFW